MTTVDAQMTADAASHLLSLGEFAAMYFDVARCLLAA